MGEGNFEDYGMRMYNPRIGRFFNIDPLAESYPELTPYQFASNTPLQAVDLDGLEKVIYLINFKDNTKSKIVLRKAGPLGDGAAVQYTDKQGKVTALYGEEIKTAEEFTKSYEGNGGLVSYYVNGKGNLTGGYGHELEGDEKTSYPEGTAIPQKVADDWFTSDQKEKEDLVDRNLTEKKLSKTQKYALVDFAFNIRKAPQRIASFTKNEGGSYFLQFSKGGIALLKRRIGESVLYDFGKFYKFNVTNASDSRKIQQQINQDRHPYIFIQTQNTKTKTEFGPQNKQ